MKICICCGGFGSGDAGGTCGTCGGNSLFNTSLINHSSLSNYLLNALYL